MVIWPHELIKDIAQRKSVLVLGSGVSRNSVSLTNFRPPTWAEFLDICLQSYTGSKTNIKRLIKEKDYLTACEIIVEKIGKDAFNQIAENNFLTPGFNKHQIHEHIYKLDSRLVVTPNVDKIYDIYANQESRGTIVVKNYYDSDLASKIRSRNKLIIKIHGTIETPGLMIFTRKQYAEARYNYAAIYEILSALLITHTFIFLGAGYNDPDTRLLLEKYTFSYPQCRPHYMVTPKDSINDDVEKVLKENCNLELIKYNSNNYHQELVDSLADLVTRVDSERSNISSSQEW